MRPVHVFVGSSFLHHQRRRMNNGFECDRHQIVLTLLLLLPPSAVIASPAFSGVAISQLEQRDCFTAFAMTFQSILFRDG